MLEKNKSQITHEYKVGDKILLTRSKCPKSGEREKMNPSNSTTKNNNGTARYDERQMH